MSYAKSPSIFLLRLLPFQFYVFQDNQGKQSKLILVSHGKQRLYPKELVPLERDNSSHLQYTFYVLRILNRCERCSTCAMV